MKTYKSFGATTNAESQRELLHKALARHVAQEGIVLLKNDGTLPLKEKKVALFGAGARMTVKGGSGSGEVHERHSVTIEEGLLNAGFEIVHPLWMNRFDANCQANRAVWRQTIENRIKGYGPMRTMKMFDIVHMHPFPYPAAGAIEPDELSDDADTAIYVISRQAGESHDRRPEKGDYAFTDIENDNLRILSTYYCHVILILNCGCVMDLSILDEVKISAVLFVGQPGMEGGNAIADILCGNVNPSGKLTDTWAYAYDDYPGAESFGNANGEKRYANYREGIYIGYRYFDATGRKPRFPFGFGLSYTDFEISPGSVKVEQTKVSVMAQVKNTGARAGKETVQLYLSKPHGKLDQPPKTLAAFGKTKLLQPDETHNLTLSFDLLEQTSFDEAQSAFILEAGEYSLLIGNSSSSAAAFAVLTLAQTFTAETVKPICPCKQSFEDYENKKKPAPDLSLPRYALHPEGLQTIIHNYDQPIRRPVDAKVRSVLSSLCDRDLISLCVGGGYPQRAYHNVQGAAGYTCTRLIKKGIPNIVMSDGPAGLNVLRAITVLKNGTQRYPEGLPEDWTWGYLKHIAPLVKAKEGQGTTYYRYMTAFPSAILRAQTFNLPLLEEVGAAIGTEMLEIGLTIWEAPGMNLHRNPLCGRNFEYYSEDVLLSGLCAAAETRGVQANKGIGACLKHFCCNNQEDNRERMSANVSARALREVYLHNFRIAAANGKPWAIMSAYNQVNGVYAPNNKDLLTTVLREEWHFDGVVMSDWNATDPCSHAGALLAGNDLIMPGNKRVIKALRAARKNGTLRRETLEQCAGRILQLIFSSAVYADC